VLVFVVVVLGLADDPDRQALVASTRTKHKASCTRVSMSFL